MFHTAEMYFATSLVLDWDDQPIVMAAIAGHMLQAVGMTPFKSMVYLSNNGKATAIEHCVDELTVDHILDRLLPEMAHAGGPDFRFNIVWFDNDDADRPCAWVCFARAHRVIHRIHLKTNDVSIIERPAPKE